MASEDGSVDEEKKQEVVAGEEVDKGQLELDNKETEKEDEKVEEKVAKDSKMEEKEEEKDLETEQEDQRDSDMEEKDEEVVEEKESEKPEENSKEEEKSSKKANRVRKGTPAKGQSKKGRGEVSLQEAPVTPVDRPTRERKTIERYTETSAGRNVAKPVSIEKGKGTQLKDIPNVAFKLSKIKPDDNLQLLHYILFGKRTKVHTLKKNIGLFSGFVWIGNEEKQKTKVKEKIDKCVKEKLIFFCDILNIPFLKATAKKEDLSVKLLEFLESPHATTEALLADNEKGKRLKGKAKSSKSPSSVSAASETLNKKRKLNTESKKKRKRPAENAEEDRVDSDDEVEHEENKDSSEDDDDNNAEAISKEESDQETKSDDEEESEKVEPKGKVMSKKSSFNGHKKADKSKSAKQASPTESPKPTQKSTKKSSMSAAKNDKTSTSGASGSSRKSKLPSSKKQKIEKDESLSAKEKITGKKQPSKSSTKVTAKDQGGNDKSSKKGKSQPSKEEMHAVVVDILKKVDFNTATLSDILKQLGTHFDVDLMHRKAEVKSIITDVINNMTDEDEEDDIDGAEGGDGDGEDDNNA